MLWIAAAYHWTHNPSRLAWSEGWQPSGTKSSFIWWTGWTLKVANQCQGTDLPYLLLLFFEEEKMCNKITKTRLEWLHSVFSRKGLVEESYIADTYEHADSVEKVTAVKRVARVSRDFTAQLTEIYIYDAKVSMEQLTLPRVKFKWKLESVFMLPKGLEIHWKLLTKLIHLDKSFNCFCLLLWILKYGSHHFCY